MLGKKDYIYADAAAATPLSDNSRKELMRLLDVYGNAGALHSEGVKAKEELESARGKIAATIGAHPDEIIFTSSGTEGNNLAIQGVLRPILIEHGEAHAITCAIEHQSVSTPLHALEREGLYVTELPVDREGLVSAKDLAEAINDDTVFISIQLINPEIGTIEPLRELMKEVRRVRKERTLPLYFHTDASQAPLWFKIAVENLGIDLMTLDGQKVLGPKGVGALYVRRGVKIEPVLWGGKQEQGLRGGTENIPLAGAFAVALADAQEGVDNRVAKIENVREELRSEIIRLMPDALINGPDAQHRAANNLNVSVPGLDGEMAVIAMDAEGIAVSTRSACSVGDEEPSHVIKAIGVPKNLSKTAIRISLLPNATSDDVHRIAQTLADVAARYRNIE